MVVAQLLVYFESPSAITVWLGLSFFCWKDNGILLVIANEILSELHGATGIQALSTLLITELFPPSARVAAAQVSLPPVSSDPPLPDCLRDDVRL